jgi:protein associated with RNAse G/E
MRPVTVQFLKNPDILHWGFDAFWLGEDEWGDWIAAPTGTARWKGDESFDPTSLPAVFLAPRDRWWHLHYNGPHGFNYTHFIDMTTPPVWVTPNRYEMIDLDLDVAIHIDGTIEVQDEDEFEVHQLQYGYSRELIDGALAATDEIITALEARSEPFFEVADSWLANVE